MEEVHKAQKIVHDKLSKSEWENNKGRFAYVNLEEEDFTIGDDVSALIEAQEKYPNGHFIGIRIGYDAAHTTGAALKPITL